MVVAAFDWMYWHGGGWSYPYNVVRGGVIEMTDAVVPVEPEMWVVRLRILVTRLKGMVIDDGRDA